MNNSVKILLIIFVILSALDGTFTYIAIHYQGFSEFNPIFSGFNQGRFLFPMIIKYTLTALAVLLFIKMVKDNEEKQAKVCLIVVNSVYFIVVMNSVLLIT